MGPLLSKPEAISFVWAIGNQLEMEDLIEEKTDNEVEHDQQDEHSIHYQVDAYIGPVLPVKVFQSFEHSRNNLPESTDSFFWVETHRPKQPFVVKIHLR